MAHIPLYFLSFYVVIKHTARGQRERNNQKPQGNFGNTIARNYKINGLIQ